MCLNRLNAVLKLDVCYNFLMRKLLSAVWLFLFVCAAGFAQTGAAVMPLTYELNSSAGGAWSFSYVQFTDAHIGFGTTDYGTPGFDDLPPETDTGSAAVNLRAAVNWVNANKDSQKIKFVAVTGDLTQHAQKSEFLKAREILDGLDVPYAPVIGNHDVWPYSVGGMVASAPVGDEYFKEVFAPAFARLAGAMPGWNDGTRLVRATDPATNTPSYFQNYAFTCASYTFVAADFIGRTYKPSGGPKSPYKIDFFDFPGGTWHWLKNYYAGSTAGANRLIILSHFPLTKETWNGYCLFTPSEYAVIADFLHSRPLITLWNAGHAHRNAVYPLEAKDGTAFAAVVETATSRETPTFRLIKVWNP